MTQTLKSPIFKYTLYGTLFGLSTVVAAILGDLLGRGEAITAASIVAAQSNQPLLWVIDSAPIFWGTMAYIVAKRQEYLRQQINERQKAEAELRLYSEQLEERVQERTQHLEKARQEAEDARRNLEAQMWLTAGQAELSEVMRNTQTTPMLAGNVIRQLCQYLNLPVGALFVLDGDMLELAGTHAFTASVEHPKQFALGEGLVGEAARRKQMLMVDDIPPDYLLIRSGLGENRPYHLLIHPFLHNGNVVGVIELGGWKPFTPPQLQFLQSVSPSIAIVFHTAQRTRTRQNQ